MSTKTGQLFPRKPNDPRVEEETRGAALGLPQYVYLTQIIRHCGK
jgi:hypothetical protein